MNTQNNKGNSGKTAYLIIITIITIVCILAGVFWHIGGWFGRRAERGLFHWNWDWDWDASDAGDMAEKGEFIDAFDSLDVNLSIGELVIKEGTRFELSMNFPEKYMPEYSISGGKLTIKQPSQINVGINNYNHEDYRLELTVPDGENFNLMKVNCSLGDIRIDGLEARKFDINESLGEIRLVNLKADDVVINNSMGSVVANDIEADNLDANLSMGDLRVESSKIEEVNCANSMGSVTFEGECSILDIDNNMGDIRVESKSDWKGSLTCDMGCVKVNGVDYGRKCRR